LQRIRERITYANVMSSLAVFLILGGGAAIAAKTGLPKKSVGTKQLKANAVTAAKIKKNAVTTAKIKKNAVTGAKVNESTLGTVPNSAATDVIKTSKGTIALGQQATVFEYAGIKLIVKCETFEATKVTARAYIESSAEGTTFLSWMDASKALGPGTIEGDREVTHPQWSDSTGAMVGEAGAPLNVTTASGASFAGDLGIAAEKDSNTCWYWFRGTIIS
jgi:hypothetical protein